MFENSYKLYLYTLTHVTNSLTFVIFGISFELYIIVMKNKFFYISKFTLFLLISMTFINSANTEAASGSIEGQVIDVFENQIIGATVLLLDNNTIVKGIATDEDGRFFFSYKDANSLTIQVRAIGYNNSLLKVNNKKTILVKLDKAIINLAPISVLSTIDKSTEVTIISQKQFEQRSKNSIITNNPINALKQPQMLKQGSALSSKLRINGTAPSYYFHNSPIGYDPNHYGMFSVIPASVVSSIKFYPNGSPAEYQLPTVIDLLPKKNFDEHLTKSAQFSLVQSTGTFSYGQKNFYTIATVRKSVLDKLIKYFDVESNRRTIPPTNFEDIVISTGYKLNSKSTLYIDQLYTRDYLAYNTGATSNNKFGLNTYQHTKTSFIGLSYQYAGNNSLLKIKLSNKNKNEEFEATPPFENLQGLDLLLSESNNQYAGKVTLSNYFNNIDITNGFEFDYSPNRKTELAQINWNHKSPDATSNNPFAYQYEMNQLFSHLSFSSNDYTVSLFSQFKYENSKIKINSGFRLEKYAHLKEKLSMLYRQRLTYVFTENNSISIFAGSFAESPVKNILENYQVLTRLFQSELSPQLTNLLSLTYQQSNLKFSVFTKQINNIASPHIDYSKVISKKQVTDGFITMQSNGSLDFIGGDISYDKKNFLFSNLDMYTFYGFTKASKESDGYKSLYELNAPHKFMVELTYQKSNNVSFGTELNYHSGFAYTPYIEQYHYTKDERYKKSYYDYLRSFENSEKFPAYYSLNLFLNYTFSDKELNFSISNLTNRANPVVHTSDGYIYDPGVMPSIAFNWKL